MSNILVAYFSASGTTEKVAQKLASQIHADLFKIQPKQAYTRADLNWNDSHSRSTLEMKDPNSRPEILNKVEKMEQYNTVFVGFRSGGIENHLLLIPLLKAMILQIKQSFLLRHLEEAGWENLLRISKN